MHTLLIPLIKLLPGLRLPGTPLWSLLAFVTYKVEGMRADTTNKHGDAPAHRQAHACTQIHAFLPPSLTCSLEQVMTFLM